jgi:hypothetical protein
MAQRSCLAPKNPGLKISPRSLGKPHLEDKKERIMRDSRRRSWILRDPESSAFSNHIRKPINRPRLHV